MGVLMSIDSIDPGLISAPSGNTFLPCASYVLSEANDTTEPRHFRATAIQIDASIKLVSTE
jgi:hypothetical protein